MKSFKTFSEENFDENFLTSELLSSTDDQHLDADEEVEELNEVSLMTLSIAAFVAKTKQYANQIDSTVSALKNNADKLDNTDMTQSFKSIADLFYLQRKMGMYDALTSAATGVGLDRAYKLLQKMDKVQNIVQDYLPQKELLFLHLRIIF